MEPYIPVSQKGLIDLESLIDLECYQFRAKKGKDKIQRMQLTQCDVAGGCTGAQGAKQAV